MTLTVMYFGYASHYAILECQSACVDCTDAALGRHLYNVLQKNHTVSEGNRGLLVETLRSIAEILIWGDQNDSTVFE